MAVAKEAAWLRRRHQVRPVPVLLYWLDVCSVFVRALVRMFVYAVAVPCRDFCCHNILLRRKGLQLHRMLILRLGPCF